MHVFLGKPDCRFICRRCLSSYSNQKVLNKHKFKCQQQEITSIRTSNESHIYWKKYFHKLPLYFKIYADFECNNELNNSNMGNKTTNIYHQKAVCNGYYIVSELNDVLKSGYHHSPLGYENVDWFVNQMTKLENKMNFYFKNTKKDIIMEEKADSNICWFCEKEILKDKVRDHCHLTGKYRGPAHHQCNINVKDKQRNFIPIIFHNFSKYDCHLFFKTLIDEKPDYINLSVIPKTNEEYISVTYGCLRFIDSYRFLQESLDNLVKTLKQEEIEINSLPLKNIKEKYTNNIIIFNKIEELKGLISNKDYENEPLKNLNLKKLEYEIDKELGFKILKKEFPKNWELLNKKLAYPYEYFKTLDDYSKNISNLTKEDYFSKLKNDYPEDRRNTTNL